MLLTFLFFYFLLSTKDLKLAFLEDHSKKNNSSENALNESHSPPASESALAATLNAPGTSVDTGVCPVPSPPY